MSAVKQYVPGEQLHSRGDPGALYAHRDMRRSYSGAGQRLYRCKCVRYLVGSAEVQAVLLPPVAESAAAKPGLFQYLQLRAVGSYQPCAGLRAAFADNLHRRLRNI